MSVIDYGFGLLTISAAMLQRLEVLQNESTICILGCTRDTSSEAMRYILGLFSMPARHKIAQVKSICRVAADRTNPLHTKGGQTTHSRLKRRTEWLNQASKTIDTCTSIENVRKAWTAIDN